MRVNESRPCRNPGLDQQYAPSDAQTSSGLAKESPGVGDVVKDIGHDDGAQALGCDRQRLAIEHNLYARTGEVLRSDQPRDVAGQKTGARAEFKHGAVKIREAGGYRLVPLLIDSLQKRLAFDDGAASLGC